MNISRGRTFFEVLSGKKKQWLTGLRGEKGPFVNVIGVTNGWGDGVKVRSGQVR